MFHSHVKFFASIQYKAFHLWLKAKIVDDFLRKNRNLIAIHESAKKKHAALFDDRLRMHVLHDIKKKSVRLPDGQS